ncbi:MAG: nitronate monooxygenase [Dehalococcoidia bacterium]
MAIRTRLTEQLGIAVPIIQAPMNWATDPRFVAAVSNAGGLGVLGPNAGVAEPTPDPAAVGERLRRLIREIRSLTDRPFAVNFPIGRGADRAFSDATVAVAVEEHAPIAIVVEGSPEVYTETLKAAGIFVMHAIGNVRHAHKAEACRVDAVIAEGYEAGGHSGFDELPVSVLVPQVAAAVRIPVIAAGGIVNGQGLVSALALGAQAVSMGTRFMATRECPIHTDIKAAIVAASDQSTLSWGRTTEVARTFRNAFAEQYRRLELGGASPDELRQFVRSYDRIPGGRRVGGLKHGDLEQGEIYLGAGAGMIGDVLSCAEVIEQTMAEAHAILERLNSLAATSLSAAD